VTSDVEKKLEPPAARKGAIGEAAKAFQAGQGAAFCTLGIGPASGERRISG
jgi:hypothetical protein